MSMVYHEVTSEALGRILRSWRVRLVFDTENAFLKLFHKTKDHVASEDRKNIFYGIDCSYCEADYFGNFKQSLTLESNERKNLKNSDCEKNKKIICFTLCPKGWTWKYCQNPY